MATIPAYSIVLWDLVPGYPIPGPQKSPPVPSGMVWVVRTGKLFNTATVGVGHGIPRVILYGGGSEIFTTPMNGTAIGELYTFGDTRVVLRDGEDLAVNVDDASWSIRISGFQLTA